ncbi:MAG: hypothetical protein V4537_03530 [Pseudomonadota bacterium]
MHRAPAAIAGVHRARVIGNGFRELDRFLNGLVVAVGIQRGARSRVAENNTANALARLRDHIGIVADDGARLRALGRSRACLFYCDGVVRRPDDRGGAIMTLGWSPRGTAGEALERAVLGTEIAITPTQIADVCAYYMAIGDGLLAVARTYESRRSVAGPAASQRPRVLECA